MISSFIERKERKSINPSNTHTGGVLSVACSDCLVNIGDMQAVLSAINGVSKRIKEVAQTHKPLFGDEHFLTGKEVCEQLYISPRTL